MNFNKYRQVVLLSVGFCGFLLLLYFLLFFKNNLVFYPSEFTSVYFFDDSTDNGHSEINSVAGTDSAAIIRFQLHKGFVSPFVGVGFRDKSFKSTDLSGYNKVKITAQGQNIKQLRVLFGLADKNVKNKKHKLANRYLEGELYLDKDGGKMVQTLNFKEFPTSQWWYDAIDQDRNEFGEPEWEHVNFITINNGLNTPLDQDCGYSIYQIKFYKDNTLIILLLILTQVLFSTSLYLFYHIRKKDKSSSPGEIVIRYAPAMQPADYSELPGYLKYIHENYSNSDLSLAVVAENSQLSERKISELISEKFNCNFKTYINLIRVAEARRLMEQTELNISEIAYKVGYNSPTSFNRVFKNTTGMSPTEYMQSIGK